MISRALSALGIGGKPVNKPMQSRPAETLEQHIMDVNIAKSDAEWWAQREIEKLKAERDEWKEAACHWGERFKLAAADLAKQAEELNDAKLHFDHLGITFLQRLADAVQDYQADALLWRAAREKRTARKGSVS